MATPTLACSAYSFGYGPAAKLILLAERLRPLGFRPVFIGSGIAHELAARGAVFDEVVEADTSDARARTLIQGSHGLLSLMDRDFAEMALALGRPLYVADSLCWMRDRVPLAFRRARRYWVQRFTAGPAHASAQPAEAIEVGPIVGPAERVGAGQRTGLVINLGGCESPSRAVDEAATYVDFVVRGIVASALPARWPGQVVVLAGARCLERLRRRFGGQGLEFASVAHDEALARFSAAALVLTSPGLTTTLECFQLGVPTLFLPPQNYSQWRILAALDAAQLAPGALHWRDFAADGTPVEQLPETARSPAVRQWIRRLSGEPAIEAAFHAGLERACRQALPDLARRQRALFDSLGANGVESIVKDLAELCCEERT